MSDKSVKGRRERGKKGKSADGTPAGVPADPMDLALLERMVKLMSQHDLSTVDVRNGDRRVVLKRGATLPTANAPLVYAAPPAQGAGGAPVQAATASSGSVATAPPPTSSDSDAGLVPIKSPMVGTFYAAPSPDAKPFVQVGSVVDEDTDVCVIEAMKVFNTIKAECRGTIVKVLVSNGSTVEFGQVLFLVKP
ncbi:MAG: acetyl-CoA carboxylase biotin carboxyl carrier protein [Tepidisphaerales bacterium]